MLTLAFQGGNTVDRAVAFNLALARGMQAKCWAICCDGESAAKRELREDLIQSSAVVISFLPEHTGENEKCVQSAVRLLKDDRARLWSEVGTFREGTRNRKSELPLSGPGSAERAITKIEIQMNGSPKIEILEREYQLANILVNLQIGGQRAIVTAHGLPTGAEKEVVWLSEPMADQTELRIRVYTSNGNH